MGDAVRNTDGSIQAALDDLFRERDIVEDAIEKLQALLAGLQGKSPKRRSHAAARPPATSKRAAKERPKT